MDNTSLHCFIVSYELRSPYKSYDELYAVLKSFSYWGHLTENTWAIVSTDTFVEIRDKLWRLMDPNDRLIVIQSGRSAAWSNLLAENEWVKQNIIL